MANVKNNAAAQETKRRLIDAAGEVFAWIGAAPRNGDWAPHVHVQVAAVGDGDLLGQRGAHQTHVFLDPQQVVTGATKGNGHSIARNQRIVAAEQWVASQGVVQRAARIKDHGAVVTEQNVISIANRHRVCTQSSDHNLVAVARHDAILAAQG
jgi:hypothetical protein